MSEKIALHGHVSPETAYLVRDYPHGFSKRCMIRYWLETRKGFGTRFVAQTSKPIPGQVKGKPVYVNETDEEIFANFMGWNKPKKGNYYLTCVMVKTPGEEFDTISYECISPYDDYGRVKEYLKIDPDNKLAKAALQIREKEAEKADDQWKIKE